MLGEISELLDTSIYPVTVTVRIETVKEYLAFNNLCASMGINPSSFEYTTRKDDLKLRNIIIP